MIAYELINTKAHTWEPELESYSRQRKHMNNYEAVGLTDQHFDHEEYENNQEIFSVTSIRK